MTSLGTSRQLAAQVEEVLRILGTIELCLCLLIDFLIHLEWTSSRLEDKRVQLLLIHSQQRGLQEDFDNANEETEALGVVYLVALELLR